MKATRTRVNVACGCGVGIVELLGSGIRISNVAVRQIAETQAKVAKDAKTGNDILEVGVLGVLLYAIHCEFDSEDIGAIDELTNGFSSHCEVGSDDTLVAGAKFYYFLTCQKCTVVRKFYNFTTVKHYRNQVLFAKLC